MSTYVPLSSAELICRALGEDSNKFSNTSCCQMHWSSLQDPLLPPAAAHGAVGQEPLLPIAVNDVDRRQPGASNPMASPSAEMAQQMSARAALTLGRSRQTAMDGSSIQRRTTWHAQSIRVSPGLARRWMALQQRLLIAAASPALARLEMKISPAGSPSETPSSPDSRAASVEGGSVDSEDPLPQGGMGWREVALTITNVLVGAGLLGLPLSFAKAGSVLGALAPLPHARAWPYRVSHAQLWAGEWWQVCWSSSFRRARQHSPPRCLDGAFIV